MTCLRYPLLSLLLVAALAACDSEGSSLYDPDLQRAPAPVIASVSPTGVVLAGVDQITIEGQNFSDDPADILVYFDDGQGNSAQGEVVEASATRLVVRTPNLPNPALRIRVAVVGARDFSNAVPLPLTAAVVPFGDIGRTEVPFGITADADGTVYLSLENEGSSVGIKRIAPDGTRSDYFASTFPWVDLALANGTLVGVRRIRAVFDLPEGGSQTLLAAFQPSSVSLAAVAADADGTVYTAGNSGKVYQVERDGSTTDFAFPSMTVRALVVGNGTLYAVGDVTGETGVASRVWSLSIAADGSLGAASVVASLPNVGSAIAAAADGTLFVGTARVVDPVYTISPSGEVAPLYPGVLTGPVEHLAYGANGQLYMVTGTSEQGGARANLLRIETRREAAR